MQLALAGFACLVVFVLFGVFVYHYAPYRHAQGLAAVNQEITFYEKLTPEQAKQALLNKLKEKTEAYQQSKLW